MKKLVLFLAMLWGAGAAGLWYWNDRQASAYSFRTVPVSRGDIRPTIRSSGTVEPEEVVDVGAQVGGLIYEFGRDLDDPAKPIGYGSRVEEGTVLARLDQALYLARVEQGESRGARPTADIQQALAKQRAAERDFQRTRLLFERNQAAPQDMDNTKAAAEQADAAVLVAKSSLEVARANLHEAQVNLGYTTIASPVNGVILDRRVNIGQTVVASLNAPSLFLIAKDLRRMQIWASVNETDIGSIHVGQPVRFTVASLPGEEFNGTVAQVRLNASMVQNIVTYTVVVEFENPDQKVLPYLTARVEFEQQGHTGVLLVPNSALRWQPRHGLIAPDALDEVATLRARIARQPENRGQGGGEGILWVRDGEFARPLAVALGLSNGTITEVSAAGLDEHTEVITGVVKREATSSAFAVLPHARTQESPPAE
ncbi:MAG: efflux RND transporter periplasmic adaptor subunit [Isosphaeraceae bacterium]